MKSIEEILEEARLRYPNGTKYVPAHLCVGCSEVCIVGDTNHFSIYSETSIIEDESNFEKNGNSYMELIYYQGKWAKIIEKAIVNQVNSMYEIY